MIYGVYWSKGHLMAKEREDMMWDAINDVKWLYWGLKFHALKADETYKY